MIIKSPTAHKYHSDPKTNLHNLIQHFRCVNRPKGITSESAEEGVNHVKCQNLIRWDWIAHFAIIPDCWLQRFKRADFLSPRWNSCLTKPVQLAAAHLQMWDVFFFVVVSTMIPSTGELTGELHGLWWRRERKGLKTRANSEKTQKHSKVPEEQTQSLLSWFKSLYVF